MFNGITIIAMVGKLLSYMMPIQNFSPDKIDSALDFLESVCMT